MKKQIALLVLVAILAWCWGYHVGHFRGRVDLIKKALEIKIKKGNSL